MACPAVRVRLTIALMAVLLCGLLTLAAAAGATTYTVTSSGDGGDADTSDPACKDSNTAAGACTLRAALQQANAHAGADAIAFDGARTIAPASQLPLITDTVVISGPVTGGTPGVELRGPGGATTQDGIVLGTGAGGSE